MAGARQRAGEGRRQVQRESQGQSEGGRGAPARGGVAGPRASYLVRMAYAAGFMPLSAAYSAIKTHAQSFAVDVEGHPPAWVGRAFFGASVLVGCLEPVLGAWSDARAALHGPRARASTLRLAFPVWVGAFAALWAPQTAGALKAVALAAFFLAHATVFLNWSALWPTFTHPTDRASVAPLKQLAQAVGMGLGMGGAPALAGPAWTHAGRLAFAFPCLMAALLPSILAVDALHLRRQRQHPSAAAALGSDDDKGASAPFTLRRFVASARDILAGSPALRLALAAQTLNGLAVGCATNAIPLYARYVQTGASPSATSRSSAMTLILVGTGMLTVPLWTAASRRTGPERAWAAGCAVLALGFALAANAATYASSMACLGVAGIGTGGVFAAQELSVMAIVDQDAEGHGGTRRDGLVAGLRAVGGHGGAALQGLLFGAVLHRAGFLPGDTDAQPDSAHLAIRALATVLPAACYAACVVCVLGVARDLAAKRTKVA